MNDNPWSHSVKLVRESNTPTGRFISDLISQEKDDTVSWQQLVTKEPQVAAKKYSLITFCIPFMLSD